MDNLEFKSTDGYFQLFFGDCFELMKNMQDNSIDMIFSDPPYFLSGEGITCSSGKMAPVYKGEWDLTREVQKVYDFNYKWLEECKRLLKPNGTLWTTGTSHNIFTVGYASQQLGYKVLNSITWEKTAPPPNLSCRYFTHSTETILWVAKNKKSKHTFNYEDMKKLNGGKQMKSVWKISAPKKIEKKFGKHPAQKPTELLSRIISASTNPGDLVLDPFNGAGTAGVVAYKLGRKYIGIDNNKEYIDITIKRFNGGCS